LLVTDQPGFLPHKVDAAPTTMTVDPQNSTAYVNATFNINITVTDVTNMVGWQITELYYLNSILNCTGAGEGPFLRSIGSTFPIFDVLNEFNSTHGRVRAASVLLGSGISANGTGVIATLNFTAITTGTTPITLGETILKDIQNQDISHTTISGNVTVTLPPIQVVDVYTQRGGVGANVSSDAFAPGETIFFNASLIFQGAPVPGIIVQFITYDPHGTPTARTSVSGQDGIAVLNFTLPSSPVFGNYVTLASATVNGNSYNDTVSYQVGWIINIAQAIVCNSTGGAQTQFPRGNLAYLNVTLDNISFNPKQLFLSISPTDAFGNQVGQEWVCCAIRAGKTSVLMGFRIPYWTLPGVGQVFVGAYNNPPWAGGLAYCPGYYLPLPISGG
jgi:hypothetical protein